MQQPTTFNIQHPTTNGHEQAAIDDQEEPEATTNHQCLCVTRKYEVFACFVMFPAGLMTTTTTIAMIKILLSALANT